MLLLSGALYGGAAVRRRFFPRLTTAVCRAYTLEDAAVFTGEVLREEQSVFSPKAFVRLTAAPGERFGAGDVLGIQYDTGEEYFRAALLLRLRREALAGEAASARPVRPALDAGDAAALSRALARRDFDAVAETALPLRLALSGPEDAQGPAAVRAELASLAAAGAEEGLIAAPAAGFFVPDGTGGAVGRLVTGSLWRLVLDAGADSAARFVPGKTVSLLLPSGAAVSSEVLSVRREDGGAAAVYLLCRSALAEVLTARTLEVRAVFSKTAGLLLPREALRSDGDGTFVYRAELQFARREAVSVLAELNEGVLVTSDGLREGSLVLLGDAPLADGAVWR